MWAFHLLSEWVNVCSFALARLWTADWLSGNLFALKSIRPVAWEDENSFPQALIWGKAACPGLPNAFPMNAPICKLCLGWNWDSKYLTAIGVSSSFLWGSVMLFKNNSYLSLRSRECCHLALEPHVPSSQRRALLSVVAARSHAHIN